MTTSNDSADINEDENIYSVESIQRKRVVNNRVEYLIKWVGYKECTWESEENILDKEMIENFEKNQNSKKTSVKRKSEDKSKVKRKSEAEEKQEIKSTTPKKSEESKENRTNINTKSKISTVDVNIVAVEEVFKDKGQDSITAKVRYKNGSYAIFPLDVVHKMAPIPLIVFYESKMVFSESKDE